MRTPRSLALIVLFSAAASSAAPPANAGKVDPSLTPYGTEVNAKGKPLRYEGRMPKTKCPAGYTELTGACVFRCTAGSECATGFACVTNPWASKTKMCAPCGGDRQDCCASNRCNEGLVCRTPNNALKSACWPPE